MMRTGLIYIAAVALCLRVAFAMAGSPANLLLIMVDDLGYGDLASYGHPIIESPNLDRLAATGIRFTEYYASSALCSPSRAALLTGRHPYRSGIRSWIPENSGIYLRDDEVTLAELLQDNGYQTALIGNGISIVIWGHRTNLSQMTKGLITSTVTTPFKRRPIVIPIICFEIGTSYPCNPAIRQTCMPVRASTGSAIGRRTVLSF